MNFIERWNNTRLSPGGGMSGSSGLGEQYLAMDIRRGATGKVERRVCYYHPNPLKRYWVRLLLTLNLRRFD